MNVRAQVCSGSWALQRPATSQCVSGQWVGWQNMGTNPPGCPANPIYTGVEENTFTFSQPVNSFSIDFRGLDGAILCARIRLSINGLFYPLTSTDIMAFPAGSTCINGSFDYIAVTNDGYITVNATGGPGLLGQGRITISGMNINSFSVATNDGAGTLFSNPFNCNDIVPLTLVDFTGSSIGCAMRLNWQSASEVNIDNIGVERSYDGLHFEVLSLVPPKGSNSTYFFTDMNRYDAFYRLKINDSDGSHDYSHVVYIKSSCHESSFKVIPNPAYDQVCISGLKSRDEVRILDLHGRLLQKFYCRGLNTTVNIAMLPRGIFLFQISNSGVNKGTLKVVRK